jgi:hypothetical protein
VQTDDLALQMIHPATWFSGRAARAALVLIPFSIASSRAAAEVGNRGEQQLVQAFIVALRSKEPSRVEELWHPASRACLLADRGLADRMLAFDLRSSEGAGSSFVVKRLGPLEGGLYQTLLLSQYFKFPVRPTRVLEVEARTVSQTSVGIVDVVVYLAQAGGDWYLDAPCLTPEGARAIRQIRPK